MTDALKLMPPRVPLLDARTGLVSREWYVFFQGLYLRVGGAAGPSLPDVAASLFEDAGSGETNALLFEVDQALGQCPGRIITELAQCLDQSPPAQAAIDAGVLAELGAIRDQIAELQTALAALNQGSSL